MARALMGHIGLPTDPALAIEVARLRRRVRELEAELVEARSVRSEHAHDAHDSASATELDLELHRIAEAGSPVPA